MGWWTDFTNKVDSAKNTVRDTIKDVPVVGNALNTVNEVANAPLNAVYDTAKAGNALAQGDSGAAVGYLTDAGLESSGVPEEYSHVVGDKAEELHNDVKGGGTDSEQINEELSKDVSDAIANGEASMNEAWKPLSDASSKYTMSGALDDYDTASKQNISDLNSLYDAGLKTQDYLNPMTSYASDAVKSVLGDGSNASNVALANAKLSGWNTANSQAMSEANLGANAAGASQNISQNALQNFATPTQDLIKYQSDWNTDKLQSDIDIAKAKALVSSADEGLLGEAKDALGVVSGVMKFV